MKNVGSNDTLYHYLAAECVWNEEEGGEVI